MQIDREAVAKTLLLALVLFAPVALGVLIVHLGILPRRDLAFHLAMLVMVGVLWLYGMIEARSKYGWSEVAVVVLALLFMCVAALFISPLTQVVYEGPGNPIRPFSFLPWLAALSLLSAHWYGRRVHTALAMSLVVTTYLSAVWYDDELYPILRRYFMWD